MRAGSLLPVLLVVIVAFALRATGLQFGLPLAEARPDEQTIAYQAMKFGRGDLNPHSFNYPSLFKYIVFVLFGADYAVGKVLGHYAGQEDFLRSFFAASPEFRLLMRAWSVVAGTVGVAVLLASPGRIWAAACLALCALHVRDSHFGVTDITMVTLTSMGALLALRLQKLPSVRNALLAGVVAGLATSTKYNAALLALPLGLAALTAIGPVGAVPALREKLKLGALAGAAQVGGFLLGTPYALLDARQFITDFSYEMGHLAEGHHIDVGVGWVHHAVRTLPHGMGTPLLLAGLLGMALSFAANARVAAVLYSFPLVYFLAIGRGETAFYRYMLPVVPFLCMAAGSLLMAVGTRFGPLVGMGVSALVLLPTTLSSLSINRLFLAGDTRAAMGAWVEANVPSDSVIVHAGAYTGAPMLQRNVPNQTREFEAKQGRADSGGFRKPDDMKFYELDRPMYDVMFVRKKGIDFASQVDVAGLASLSPACVEIERSGLQFYSAVDPEVHRFVREGYALVHEERSSVEGKAERAIFDQQDAFYMPVAGLEAASRMGPDLVLFCKPGVVRSQAG